MKHNNIFQNIHSVCYDLLLIRNIIQENLRIAGLETE